MNDHDAFLAEMHRVLGPGGTFVISTHHPIDDYRRLGGSYFDHERVMEHWGIGWDVATWRMPLTELTEGFHRAGFLIERLIEPRPVAAMRDRDRRVFDKLETAPAFILFRLVKRPG